MILGNSMFYLVAVDYKCIPTTQSYSAASGEQRPHNLGHISELGNAVKKAHAHVEAVVVPFVSYMRR